MATAARFAAGGSNSPPTPAPATTPPVQTQTTQLIVLPASIHQAAAGGAIVNGVPVIDVSALEQGGESSNESVNADQGDAQDGETIEQTPPHFITVTEAAARSYASLTPVQTTVVASEGDTVASHPGYQLQYVESEIYASQTNGGQASMAYPLYTVGDTSGTIYTSQGQFYATANANGTPNSNAVGYATTGAHYLVQQTVDTEALIASTRNSPQTTNADTSYVATATVHAASSSSQIAEEVGSALGHATRVSPLTIQWLLEHYETAEGVSLPRSTLYAHYISHCSDHKLEPVNAASFGKLIRSVFLGLRTRRLGTRGNSKYHYYGIRVKPGKTIVGFEDTNGRNFQSSSGISGKGAGNTNRGLKRANDCSDSVGTISQHLSYLGDGSNAIPKFPDIIYSGPLPKDCSYDDVDTLKNIYHEHLEAFLDAIMSLEFGTVDSLWREFWRSQDNNNGDECEEEKYLSKSKLLSLCHLEPIQTFVKQIDLLFYQNLMQILIPDVLKPIPATLTQSIRNFAKSLESWLTTAMIEAPANMFSAKLSAVRAFSSSMRRYTSLNHLAQAARAVLHNSTQIAQMLSDLSRVDFHSVREQAAWVCECEHEVIKQFELDFKLTLQQQNSLEQWASWLQDVVQAVLKQYEGRPNFSHSARQFLLKWSFYSSMVIRDLTLRSAASFGSFHLIRLLYDEYMFYIIEHKVAEATGVVPIAVMDMNKQEVVHETNDYGGDISICNGNINLQGNGAKLNNCNSPNQAKRMKIS